MQQSNIWMRRMKINSKLMLTCLFLGSMTYIMYKNFSPSSNSVPNKRKPFWSIKHEENLDTARRKLNQTKDSAKGDFVPKKDVNCIRTVEEFRSADGTFSIPSDYDLAVLPTNVIDCLYQRVTTTIQYFCAKRSRHGSVKDGWNICTDGCYKPNNKTVIYVLSTVNDYENVLSVDLVYNINVNRHKPSTTNGTDMHASPKNMDTIGSQTIELDSWSDAVKNGSNGQDILIIDVENLTEKIVDHVINSKVLNVIQQLSIRISYGDSMSGIAYLAALKQLKKIFEAGFRIYWSRQEWSCIIANNKDRTSCVYLDMVFHKCRGVPKDDTSHQHVSDHGHIVIPEDMVLRKLNKTERLELYSRYLTSVQTHCKEVLRIGVITDGGWNVCHDKPYRPSVPCLVYSFGINNDFSFDDYMVSTYGCDVHSFDPSMRRHDFRRGDHIWFHNLGLSSVTGKQDKWKVSTLKDIIDNLNHTSRSVNILKMDIENSEWTSLPNIIQSRAIRNTKQLLVEFHGSSASLEKLKTLKEIYNEGFRIYWYHRNPAKGNLIQSRFVQNSACYEVYFVRI